VRQLDEIRMHQLNDASSLFSNILGSIGVDIQPENLKMFINANKSAIENRYLQCLEPKLSFQLDSKDDVDTFWSHMEIIYNLMNPYNKIKRNIASDLVSNIISKITSSENVSPANLVGEIMSKDTLEQMATIMSAPNGLPNILSTLMTAIGNTNDSDSPDMSNFLNSLMKSVGN
jgi:hypothetical protein